MIKNKQQWMITWALCEYQWIFLSSMVSKKWRSELSPFGNIQSWTADREPRGHTGENMQKHASHIAVFICVSWTVSPTVLQLYWFLDQHPAHRNVWISLYFRTCVFPFNSLYVSLTLLQFCSLSFAQVLPKMTSHVVSEIDHILGNRPYSKRDYRS